MGAVSSMAQVNVRVDVARSRTVPRRCCGFRAGHCPSSSKGGGQGRAGWRAVRGSACGRRRPAADRRARYFVRRIMGGGGSAYADLGIATSPVSDGRDWDTIYSEAMDERYRQKGMILVSGAPLKIMVDANVWVDSFCADHDESLAARAFIGQATEAGHCWCRCISPRTCCTLSNTS